MNILQSFRPITTFIFDVDGVLTDGTVLVLAGGLQARRMHIKDGFALQLAIKKGYRVRVISGGNSPEVAEHLYKLGVTDVHMSVLDKKGLIEAYLETEGLKKEEVLYMGDDLPDLPAMQAVGLSCCPADSAADVLEAAQYVSPLPGGFACVRDVIEKVLRLNGHWSFDGEVASR